MVKKTMKPATAIKTFLEQDARKIPLKEEFVPFKAACASEEWSEMARHAAEQLGVELDLT